MPSDKRKPLTEAMEEDRANPTTETGKMRLQLETKLTEIGHLWIGQSVDNCEDRRDENLRRFKLYVSPYTLRTKEDFVNLTLWYGKSVDIPCDDWRLPHWEDATIHFNAVDHQWMIISITIRDKKNEDFWRFKKGIFSIFIGNIWRNKIGGDCGVLPPKYQKFSKGTNRLDDILAILEEVGDIVRQHPQNPLSSPDI